jgi:hypothetical protein
MFPLAEDMIKKVTVNSLSLDGKHTMSCILGILTYNNYTKNLRTPMLDIACITKYLDVLR